MINQYLSQPEIASVLKQNSNIIFAYIFGSQANGGAHFGSDLDIAIYVKKNPELLEIGQIVNDLDAVTDFKIDLALLNDLDKTNPKLAYHIANEGKLLFCSDAEALTEYKKNAMVKYLDFKPYLDLFSKALNDRIANKKLAVIEE